MKTIRHQLLISVEYLSERLNNMEDVYDRMFEKFKKLVYLQVKLPSFSPLAMVQPDMAMIDLSIHILSNAEKHELEEILAKMEYSKNKTCKECATKLRSILTISV